jgi:predicted TPR repeat methyltransferase
VVAADVFVYIEDLSAVFAGVRGALRQGGHFAFSVEASEQREDFVLGTSLRYAHSADYLRRLAEHHGLALAAIEPTVVRQQDGMDVPGYIAMLNRA